MSIADDDDALNLLTRPWDKEKLSTHLVRLLGAYEGLLQISRGKDMFLRNPLTRLKEDLIFDGRGGLVDEAEDHCAAVAAAIVWCVSKRWRTLIDDPNFNFSTQRRKVAVLLCPIWLPVLHEEPFFIEYLYLQAIDDELNKRDDPDYDVNAVAVLSGLCYNSLLDDYKVVTATDIESIYASPDSRPKVAGFSNCRREGWKQARFPYNIRWVDDSCGAVVNGHLHWLLRPEDHPSFWTADDIRQVIVCFDQTSDKFEEIPLPGTGDEEHVSGLVVMDGCLCLAIKESHHGGDDGSFQCSLKVWAMKDYGAHNSWTPVFTLSTFRCGCLDYRLICFTKDRNAMMRDDGDRRIVAYNRKEDLQSDILIEAKPLRIKVAITYVESLNPRPIFA
ncbi:hypothetical protein RJ639_007030 [Escallonia herrerae]|uniref:F-box associated beta-propeller type 1 domain-containing protein n=1 Tax=Escallonia herrerae TaxID=1293975 RepID=A0AA88W309_9ASTE|nr:hypothetical protein RJ639_007030 [Escallonia herrerae]